MVRMADCIQCGNGPDARCACGSLIHDGETSLCPYFIEHHAVLVAS